jgi:hypothetical protein
VTAPIDLARSVGLVAGTLSVGLAGACAVLRGPADAIGVLVGSALTLLNFGGLAWIADRAVGRRTAARSIWVGASGVRLGLIGLLVGVAVTQTGVGVAGLLVSLTVLPVAVIATGLWAARTT